MSKLKMIGKGFASVLITLFSLHQTVHDSGACLAFIIAAIILSISAYFIRKKNRQDAFIAILSALIMLVYSAGGIIHDKQLKKNEVIWVDFLHSLPEDGFSDLKRNADLGDGPSQLELSLVYTHQFDYHNALKYAQKAANNGNAEACSIVARSLLFGMGCIADIQQGVSYLIRAQQLDNYNIDTILQEMSDRGIPLSENDRMKLDQSNNIRYRLTVITDLVASTYNHNGNESTILLIHQFSEELNHYSLMGYLPATKLLYFWEILKKPNGSPELKRLAYLLYQANQIPTQPIDRGYFLHLVHNDGKDYDTKMYKQYIKDNNYYLVGLIETRGPMPSFQYDRYSNKYLIAEYELFRSQYDWFAGLMEGTIPSNRFVFSLTAESYANEVLIAQSLLRQTIRGVQLRMQHPDLGTSEKEDWLDGYSIEIDFRSKGLSK